MEIIKDGVDLQSIVDRFTEGHLIELYLLEAKEEECMFPNAYAVFSPEGKPAIFLCKNLLEFLTVEELYFVLAHETAHHLNSHLIVRANTQMLKDLLTGLFKPKKPSWFKRIFLGEPETPTWWVALESTLQGIINRTLYADQEREADKEAIKLMKKAGLPLNGVKSFFHKLELMAKVYGTENMLGDEHDPPNERWKYLKRKYKELRKL